MIEEEDLAEEVFKVWDKNQRRYITVDNFADSLIALGLAPNVNSVRKIMVALKGANANFSD